MALLDSTPVHIPIAPPPPPKLSPPSANWRVIREQNKLIVDQCELQPVKDGLTEITNVARILKERVTKDNLHGIITICSQSQEHQRCLIELCKDVRIGLGQLVQLQLYRDHRHQEFIVDQMELVKVRLRAALEILNVAMHSLQILIGNLYLYSEEYHSLASVNQTLLSELEVLFYFNEQWYTVFFES